MVAAYTLRGSGAAVSGTASASRSLPQTEHLGSKRPSSRSSDASGHGTNEPMGGASVPAFAVDHHRAGEHEAPLEATLVKRLEQRGGRAVVVGDVGGDIAEVHAEADHRRLVGHRVDTRDRAPRDVQIAKVPEHVGGAAVEVIGSVPVRGRQQCVHRDDLHALGHEAVDDR